MYVPVVKTSRDTSSEAESVSYPATYNTTSLLIIAGKSLASESRWGNFDQAKKPYRKSRRCSRSLRGPGTPA